ncbi:MAG: hypothetical protein KGL91_12170 [Xanthomonadaceae bacterium]|nr:hypothetical protein [Xanthomonadaceae bacterium]
MDEDGVLDIDDPAVPADIREHAARFRVNVRFVGLDGRDFYLFDAEGELVDAGYLR